MPQADAAPRVNCTADASASSRCKETRTSRGSGPRACSGVGSFCSIGGWAGGWGGRDGTDGHAGECLVEAIEVGLRA